MFILLILKKKNCLLQFYEKSALRRKCILWWKKDDLPCINFCVCVSVTLLQWWKPTQTSYQYATSIIFLWRIYVWLCYQDMSQGKFDAVPFFELKISQVASCSLKSPLSPKAAIPFTGKSTALYLRHRVLSRHREWHLAVQVLSLSLPWKSKVNICDQR